MEDWIIGVLLAFFLIIPCWLALSRRNEVQKQVDAWLEVSQRTGLTFDPNIFNIPKVPYHYPGLRGEYRDRSLTVKLFGDSERNEPPNTFITIDLKHQASFSLSIQARRVLDYIYKTTEFPSANQDFDRRFSVRGSPHEYVQEAVDLIVRSDPPLLAWIMRSFPYIELKGENLFCSQNSELTNLDDQIALLNLLCDLAELAEKIGRDHPDHDNKILKPDVGRS
jgi:hypothetical protein